MNASAAVPRPVTILLCALGGEGGGVLSDWLVDAARRAGFPVQSTSIPGVAQRTGATTYYLEVVPVARAALGGRNPVLSLYPVPGALDLLVSSELLETARQVAGGMVSPDRTLVVTSSARALTTNAGIRGRCSCQKAKMAGLPEMWRTSVASPSSVQRVVRNAKAR